MDSEKLKALQLYEDALADVMHNISVCEDETIKTREIIDMQEKSFYLKKILEDKIAEIKKI